MNKSLLFIIIMLTGVCASFISCGNDDNPANHVNHPPYMPNSPLPMNDSTDISVDADLYWRGGDPDGDEVNYSLYFDSTESVQLVVEDYPDTFFYLGTLDAHTTYYWQIVAYDFFGDSAVGPLWNFTTGDSADLPPYRPSNPSPPDSAVDQPLVVNLSWEGGDPNSYDTVRYDVYLDTTIFPLKVDSNLTSPEYATSQLEPETQYYWRVVAFDNSGDSTAGYLWNFTTGPGNEGVFAAMAIARMITPVADSLFRMDEIVARFDYYYAPDDPILPLEAERVTCNDIIVPWDSTTNRYKYTDMIRFSFLELDSIYTFIVSPSASVPALSQSIRFPADETYITSPALDDTVSLDGFTTQWAGAGDGEVMLMILSGNDTTAVSFTTANDGEYTFSANDLAPLGGQASEYGIMLIHQNDTSVSASGYDSRSYIWARIINVVQIYIQ